MVGQFWRSRLVTFTVAAIILMPCSKAGAIEGNALAIVYCTHCEDDNLEHLLHLRTALESTGLTVDWVPNAQAGDVAA